jgi:hypothetical protein
MRFHGYPTPCFMNLRPRDFKGPCAIQFLNFAAAVVPHLAEFAAPVQTLPAIFHYSTSTLQYKALCYKPEGCGFDSRLCHWKFSLTDPPNVRHISLR